MAQDERKAGVEQLAASDVWLHGNDPHLVHDGRVLDQCPGTVADR